MICVPIRNVISIYIFFLSEFGAVATSLYIAPSIVVNRPFYFELKHKEIPLFNGVFVEPAL